MIILILLILGVILGIVFTHIGCNDFNNETCLSIGISLNICCGAFLLIMIVSILRKPLEYKNFKIEYETVKQTITSSFDIRDTNYTQKIIEINTKINTHREYLGNIWIGVVYNKQIAELELLKK